MAFKMNKGFLNFKIKAIAKEPKVNKGEKRPSSASLTVGIVELTEDNDFVVSVKSSNNSTEEVKYKFTGESYKVHGKTVLYTKKPDKKGVYTAVIKSKNDALLCGDYSTIYNPFKPELKVKGKILTILGEKYFDLIEVCNPECYVSY